MIRLLVLDVLPFAIFVGLFVGTWLYDRTNLISMGVLYALIFFLYEKLNRIEFSLSEEMREAILLKTDNRLVYGMAKLLIGVVVGGGLYFNAREGWLDLPGELERLGLTAAREGSAEEGPAPREVPREETPGAERHHETARPPQTDGEPHGNDGGGRERETTERHQIGPERDVTATQEPPEREPAGRTEPDDAGPRSDGEPTATSNPGVPPISNLQFEED